MLWNTEDVESKLVMVMFQVILILHSSNNVPGNDMKSRQRRMLEKPT